jgi:hypothetical protein
MDYIQNVLLPETNKYVSVEITLREFFVFLGCLFFMACHPVDSERDVWWSKESISQGRGSLLSQDNAEHSIHKQATASVRGQVS